MKDLVVPGAIYLGEGRCRFRVWAPFVTFLEVHIFPPDERFVPLVKDAWGYHEAVVENVEPGTLYKYCLDGEKERPDPASRYQPQGVHGPSQVTHPHYRWVQDSWPGVLWEDYVIYELHVATFSEEGSFTAVIPYLDGLKQLGVTAIELMPVAQFPGARNWGYDGVYPYAVQNTYGKPEDLKRLVDACHERELAIVLDVVYNHLGPEGNYLWDYGPYFTDRYSTPWGEAINFDGPYSDQVRSFFLHNSLYWLREFRFDALRIDAVHGICDFSARHILLEMGDAVADLAARENRRIYVIPESDLNDSRLIRSKENGGFALRAQWNDDFHHAVHTLLTREQNGYYQDFGTVADLAAAYRDGYVYAGRYSRFRKRKHGNSSRDLPADRFVVFSQNHDQVGNRMLSERLSSLVSFEALKLAAGVVLLSPFIPLLFMGEEYGEPRPFPYFVSHTDPDLVEAVREGRKREFEAFEWAGEPRDPQAEATFLAAKLDRRILEKKGNARLYAYYRQLLQLRKAIRTSLADGARQSEVMAWENPGALLKREWTSVGQMCLLFSFQDAPFDLDIPLPPGLWTTLLDSAAHEWNGPGSKTPAKIRSQGRVSVTLAPLSCVVLIKDEG